MSKGTVRGAALAAASGMMVAFAGCGGGKMLRNLAWEGGSHFLFEMLLDNDSIFDPIQDDYGTGTHFDDRFSQDPDRQESTAEEQSLLDIFTGR